MVLPTTPIEETDPELATWFKRGKSGTVLIQMGTLWDTNADHERLSRNIAEMARGILIMLDQVPDVQVLWKIKLPHKLDPGLPSRVRIVAWLQAEPSFILSSGHIVAVIHHGGGNSYGEATRAGVPQIILPAWYDCYEFAARAEYFGVGVWANKSVAPTIDGRELGTALTNVMSSGDDGKPDIREKARQVGEMIRGKGEGRAKAAETMLNVAREQIKKAQNRVKLSNGSAVI